MIVDADFVVVVVAIAVLLHRGTFYFGTMVGCGTGTGLDRSTTTKHPSFVVTGAEKLRYRLLGIVG